MSKKNLLFLSVFFAFLQLFCAFETKAQLNNPKDYRERFIVEAMRMIHSAEATYQATTGNGAFGTLAELRQVEFIDAILADGAKYGYLFVLTKTNPTATTPARFFLTATPYSYPKSGRHSFFIDEGGEFHGADKNGGVADASDPIIDTCASFGNFAFERCAIGAMRTFLGAQYTYQATAGNGNFGSLSELLEIGLINSRMASSTNHDYTFIIQTVNQQTNSPASFNVKATPVNYGVTGVRSFFIDENGILRGADKHGEPADENDPPIEN